MSTRVDTAYCGLTWYWQIAALCLAAALVISRQPEALFHPQFYGEDGNVWFADAYNVGWFRSLFNPHTGYFQTLPRLAAALALVFPLLFAPLVMNLVGLAFQLLPVPILLSARLSRWGSLPFRSLLAFVYLALPNSRELNLTITEAQWHLALAACLLVLAEPPRGIVGRLFDICVFVLCGLTGPFCILLLPIVLATKWLRKHAWGWAAIALVGCTSCIELSTLVLVNSPRQYPLPLGASLEGFTRIIGGHVFLGAFLGSNPFASVASMRYLVTVVVVGTATVCFVAWRTGTEFRLFLLFSALLLAASLHSPLPGPPGRARTAWQVVAGEPGVHYWFFPTLALLWGVISLLLGPKRTQVSQAIGILLALMMLVGFVRDWRYADFPDMHFAYYAGQLMESKRGQAFVIPETPPGWTLRLVKK